MSGVVSSSVSDPALAPAMFIIGDVHGQFERLQALLRHLGYQCDEAGWFHPTHKTVFVGDLIDRGPGQRQVLALVRTMIERGQAYMVMGNHEFNAIGWATEYPVGSGSFLRSHTHRNRHQHKVFLEAFDADPSAHEAWIEWFRALPLFLEFADLRVIHACWDEAAMSRLRPYLDERGALLPQYWPAAFTEGEELYDLLETLLKGPELPLPEGVAFQDKDGNHRTTSRIRWWRAHGGSWREMAVMSAQQAQHLPELPIPSCHNLYTSDKPVVIGHYWLTGEPALLAPTVACVDYSAAAEHGKLVAYEWTGSAPLHHSHFHWIE